MQKIQLARFDSAFDPSQTIVCLTAEILGRHNFPAMTVGEHLGSW
jgi:hypothetical protein